MFIFNTDMVKIKKATLFLLIAVMTAFNFSGCGMADARSLVVARDAEDAAKSVREEERMRDAKSATSVENKDVVKVKPKSKQKEVPFDIENAYGYCTDSVCRYAAASKLMIYELYFDNDIPKTDDDNIYLFEFSTFEATGEISGKNPICTRVKSQDVAFVFPFETRHLFSSFVPAVKYCGEYVPIATGRCISNPEALAANKAPYLTVDSKKGLLLDANTIGKRELTDLNVKRVVFNIPLSYVCGESTNPAMDTVKFEYDGKTYDFDGYMLAGFDSLFEYLTNEGYHTTAIILNDWNEEYPEMLHPLSRKKTGRSMYYAFNTEEEEGVRHIEAAALFLAGRYSGEHGMVYDWVIANEVNQQKIWNYMATDNLSNYTKSFEKSFRTFYNAIKSNYANANVYFSVDHDWNDNGGNNGRFFNARDFLYEFNKCAKMCGDYDWGISIHPYPSPLTKLRFWNDNFDKTEESPVLTPMNLSTLTDVMTKKSFRDTKGEVRNIGVTEVGFSSKAGEKLQAAAFAYCYYIIEDNEYVESYLLNRQTDDSESLKSGLAIGIYNNDYSAKYIKDVFAKIDTDEGKEYIPEMLDLIGADSLESALERAR